MECVQRFGGETSQKATTINPSKKMTLRFIVEKKVVRKEVHDLQHAFVILVWMDRELDGHGINIKHFLRL
jgi:hypothetical protein